MTDEPRSPAPVVGERVVRPREEPDLPAAVPSFTAAGAPSPRVFVTPEGGRYVLADEVIASIEDEIAKTEAELLLIPSRVGLSDEERDSFMAEVADAVAATRERLARHAASLQATGQLAR